jgi:hypothetical protein
VQGGWDQGGLMVDILRTKSFIWKGSTREFGFAVSERHWTMSHIQTLDNISLILVALSFFQMSKLRTGIKRVRWIRRKIDACLDHDS